MTLLRLVALSISLAAFVPGHASANDTQIVKGVCTAQSHIAEGGINQDLTKRRSRFFCDAAVVTFFSDNPNHVMIQFADSKSNHARQLGYAGLMEGGGQIMDVDHVYIEPGRPTPVEQGFCKFFFKRRHMDSVACGARIEEGDRALSPTVVFQAAPGQ